MIEVIDITQVRNQLINQQFAPSSFINTNLQDSQDRYVVSMETLTYCTNNSIREILENCPVIEYTPKSVNI